MRSPGPWAAWPTCETEARSARRTTRPRSRTCSADSDAQPRPPGARPQAGCPRAAAPDRLAVPRVRPRPRGVPPRGQHRAPVRPALAGSPGPPRPGWGADADLDGLRGLRVWLGQADARESPQPALWTVGRGHRRRGRADLEPAARRDGLD